ncbi:MAG: Flp family type IVb pilin [Shimia sp.]
MTRQTFRADQSGAVTVDWVVLTAAIVGLGIAAMTTVSDGVRTASNDIANCVRTHDTMLDPQNGMEDYVEAMSEVMPDC